MSNVAFRPAILDDIESVVRLIAEDQLGATREDLGPPINPRYAKAFKALSEDSNQLLAVADDNGAIIGCLQITFIPGLSRTGMWRGHIESVRIAQSHRGSGIGRQFFDWAIEQCRARNCGLVQLTSDKSRADARRFYEDLGFVASHEGLKLTLD